MFRISWAVISLLCLVQYCRGDVKDDYKNYIDAIKEHVTEDASFFETRTLSSLFATNSIFPCRKNQLFNILPKPKSVHRLRPNNIEVIAAMGDSITSANGAKATNLSMVSIQDRGVSWSIGAETPGLENLITLPSTIQKQ